MTVFNVGDKGQRYELHLLGWPRGGDNIIGWGDDKWKLTDTALELLKTAPNTSKAYIVDRKAKELIEIEP